MSLQLVQRLPEEQGDRPQAAAEPGKSGCGRAPGSGDGKVGQTREAGPQQTDRPGLWSQRKERREAPPWGPWEGKDATEKQTPPETVVIWGE